MNSDQQHLGVEVVSTSKASAILEPECSVCERKGVQGFTLWDGEGV